MRKFVLFTLALSGRKVAIRTGDVERVEASEIGEEGGKCTKIIIDSEDDIWLKVSDPIEDVVEKLNKPGGERYEPAKKHR